MDGVPLAPLMEQPPLLELQIAGGGIKQEKLRFAYNFSCWFSLKVGTAYGFFSSNAEFQLARFVSVLL